MRWESTGEHEFPELPHSRSLIIGSVLGKYHKKVRTGQGFKPILSSILSLNIARTLNTTKYQPLVIAYLRIDHLKTDLI